MTKDEVPEYMLAFKSEERDDGPDSLDELPKKVSRRPENYGKFRVGLESTDLYIIDIENETYVEFSGCNEKNMKNVAKTIEELENSSFEEAKDEVYGYFRNDIAAEKLDTFVKGEDIPEEDKEYLLQIKEDWMPDLGGSIRSEIEEDLPQYREEGFEDSEIKKFLAETYSRPASVIKGYMREIDEK